jgi:hypothetical protein
MAETTLKRPAPPRENKTLKFAALAVVVVLGAVAFLLSSGLFVGPREKDTPTPTQTDDTHARVTISGRTFNLELAIDEEKRFRGLSGREVIPADGGMLFVFPRPMATWFVMRDCPVPIDIIFLDPTGRITAMHEMQPDPPRAENEKELDPPFSGAPAWSWVNQAYEERLSKFPSKYAAQFAIELKGGTLPSLNLNAGDKIELDLKGLVARAK